MPLRLLRAGHLQTGVAGRWGAPRSCPRRLSRPGLRQATFKKKTVFGKRTESSRAFWGPVGTLGLPCPPCRLLPPPGPPSAPQGFTLKGSSHVSAPPPKGTMPGHRTEGSSPRSRGPRKAHAWAQRPMALECLQAPLLTAEQGPPSSSFFRAVTTGVPVRGL